MHARCRVTFLTLSFIKKIIAISSTGNADLKHGKLSAGIRALAA
jgi:hypothetical protein